MADNALATDPTQPLVDETQPVAPPIEQTLAGNVANNANANAAINPNPRAPGAWARNIMGGVVDALSGFVQGGGAGVQQAQNLRANQQQRAQQRQQQIENARQQQQMTREEAIARATIAHENAATAFDQMQAANLNYDNRQKNIANGKLSIQPYTQAGAEIIQQDIDSDEVQSLIQQRHLDPTQAHAFATGEKPILDANGQQKFDEAGNPLMRPTYTVVGDVPEVTLTDDQAKFISENTQYKQFPAGTKMSGLVYGTLIQQATSAATAKASIDEARQEAGIKAANTQVTADAQKMLPDWNIALAKSGNDPFKALQYMQTDKTMVSKYPNAATLVQSLYGGPKAWDEMRDKHIEQQQKQQELDQKKKEVATNFEGDPNAANPQAFLASLDPNARAAVQLVGEGRAPLNSPTYLLARKPEFLGAVEKAYPDFDASKVSSYQKTYQDYTSGDVSKQLTSGATALEHLAELQQLNTMGSRVPGTAAHQAYQNKVDTVAAELARFYGNTTEQGIKSYRDTLNSTFNRDAAIRTQAISMGDRLDNFETQWKNAAPSKAYQAPMPGISQGAKDARAKLDPEYAARLTQQQPVTIYASAPGKPRLMSNDNGKTWQTAPAQQ